MRNPSFVEDVVAHFLRPINRPRVDSCYHRFLPSFRRVYSLLWSPQVGPYPTTGVWTPRFDLLASRSWPSILFAKALMVTDARAQVEIVIGDTRKRKPAVEATLVVETPDTADGLTLALLQSRLSRNLIEA